MPGFPVQMLEYSTSSILAFGQVFFPKCPGNLAVHAASGANLNMSAIITDDDSHPTVASPYLDPFFNHGNLAWVMGGMGLG
jgi:hypothetical protein